MVNFPYLAVIQKSIKSINKKLRKKMPYSDQKYDETFEQYCERKNKELDPNDPDGLARAMEENNKKLKEFLDRENNAQKGFIENSGHTRHHWKGH